MSTSWRLVLSIAVALAISSADRVVAQPPRGFPGPGAPAPGTAPPTPAPPIESIGEGLLRVGAIRVDVNRREIAVPGVVNQVNALEFVANTPGGSKAYESLLTLETSGAGFNLALILIGCDQSRSIRPRRHFDPETPQGDPLEIWVDWDDGGRARRVRAEDLLWDHRKGASLPRGPWVYTGSFFLRDGRYLADAHGVLIGFVHTPAPVIENPLPHGVGGYGSFVLDPNAGLKPGTAVRLTVRALGP